MKGIKTSLMLLSAALILVAFQVFAAPVDHKDFIKGPFKDGPSVTKACLECHEKQATDFMKTTHWTFAGTPNHIKGMENDKKLYGKKNMINNFCTSPFNGPDGLTHESCFKCHPGYGWTRSKFDLTDKTKVDCLVCHAQKGEYERASVGCGVDEVMIKRGVMDLEKAAQSVANPTNKNCGSCHFYGGGGDAVKNAALDSTLLKADKKQDVHMASKAKGGLGMNCVDCHKTKEHRISGASSQLPHFDARTNCEDCHSGAKAPHKKSKNAAILAKHIDGVACQTCHIPVFAKGQPNKLAWFWEDVGRKDLDEDKEDENEKEVFAKKKGTFKWGKNVVPVYRWYNGKITKYMLGDKIADPSKPVVFTHPDGNINDKKAKIFPYKYYQGSMPMDSKFKYISTFQQYESLWIDYNWEKALVQGSKCSDYCLPYSGKYQFVKTEAFLSVAHEVSPKEDALQCGECHMGGKRMDWAALGYKGDPMQVGGRNAGGVAAAKMWKKKKKRN